MANISDNNIFANNELTEYEREAVSTYSGQCYVEIKKFLRTGEIEEEWREWAEKITNLVSNVIKNLELMWIGLYTKECPVLNILGGLL